MAAGSPLNRLLQMFRKPAGDPVAEPKAPHRKHIRRGAKAEFDGASFSPRTHGWKRNGRDANAELHPAAMYALRGIARELVRNNPFAERAVAGIANNMVGAGITFQIRRNGVLDKDLTALAKKHFESTDCDAEGRHNFYGLQLIAAREIVTGGAAVARRRWRKKKDGLTVPFQIQLLESDYINMMLSAPSVGGGVRMQGVELDAIGRRTGYWLYAKHPGSVLPLSLDTSLIPANDVAHVFRATRPEAVHGPTWFAPVIVRMKDFGDYEDAQLVRQKIASCYTVFKIGEDGSDEELEDSDEPGLEAVEPGIIETLPPGTDVKFAEPPGVDGYDAYSRVSLHAIAAGLGVPYELLTGDLSGVNFSSGRMGWLEFQRSIDSWQWNFFIPQFCVPAGQWFLDAVAMTGQDVTGCEFVWTPPAREMIDPATEVPANRDAVRAGQKTPSQVVRERGEDPETFFAEFAADMKRFDDLGLVLDCDPRRVTQVGNSTYPNRPDPQPPQPTKKAA
ncbi:MAG TPA: phage portal protein [Sphingomonas sp.]|nr:phage portal protein [Sphingomonas sp.]